MSRKSLEAVIKAGGHVTDFLNRLKQTGVGLGQAQKAANPISVYRLRAHRRQHHKQQQNSTSYLDLLHWMNSILW